jgi:hypothetical protein
MPASFAESYRELYPDATVDVLVLMWKGDVGRMWRKGRLEALEDAARICFSLVPKYERFDDQRGAGNKARECASAIRDSAVRELEPR